MDPTSESKFSGIVLVLAALVLAAGITACESKVAVNTATAKGLAERIVPADQATWSISDSLPGKTQGGGIRPRPPDVTPRTSRLIFQARLHTLSPWPSPPPRNASS